MYGAFLPGFARRLACYRGLFILWISERCLCRAAVLRELTLVRLILPVGIYSAMQQRHPSKRCILVVPVASNRAQDMRPSDLHMAQSDVPASRQSIAG